MSAARALISNQIGFPLGCQRINKILHWIRDSEISYPIFGRYAADTHDLPIGTERLLCERNALLRFDERLERVNRKYRIEVLETCLDILERFAQGDPSPEKDSR